MNILPKKSWHVLSKDNIQRVRRDEAAARAEEEEKQQRAALAEKEARLNLMRKRARDREGVLDESCSSTISPGSDRQDRHINFFSDIQQGVGLQLSNVDHERDKKVEQEVFEKKIGLLNYLVDKNKSDDPWYVTDKKKGSDESTKSKRLKDIMDPMNDMKGYLDTKRKCLEHTPGTLSQTPQKAPVVDHNERHTHLSKHTHKHSHSKKHKHKLKKADKGDRLEKLRKERYKREEAEKIKSEELLKHHLGISQPSASTTVDDQQISNSRKYNSQFNPHLARQ